MKQVLVVYYSQSGQVARAVDALITPLAGHPQLSVTKEAIQPAECYPYPWRSILRFFGVLPATVLGLPSANQPLSSVRPGKYDLVVLAYPVWFLMPALPMQQLLMDSEPEVLRGVDVVSLVVCRGMWHHATQHFRQSLRACDCTHRDNIVVTHQGPTWATFITVPRQLIFGTNSPLARSLPAAGISQCDLDRLQTLGEHLAGQLNREPQIDGPFLAGQPAVDVKGSSILPELVAWPFFRTSAVLLHGLGRIHPLLRDTGIVVFAGCLVCLIVLGLPLGMLLYWSAKPFLRGWLANYAASLAEPTGIGPP